MFSSRGDAHHLYLQLKKERHLKENKYLKETADIQKFYETVDSHTLKLIYYRMVKEKNGLGIIPIFATGIPWLLFLFSNKIQDFLLIMGTCFGSFLFSFISLF
ncbi:hypothetical protein [Paracerasibacillus soli]|uniref:Uncharacterized protein n=1 Tax=Paracerasibacillus soli TaxID=480284 RepID=A0ABU5CWK0_9BACI|nr:hypothetical protein [Virgibacillus soli]MDY0410232.1 hypothetical protein [Virgibacillus soli]